MDKNKILYLLNLVYDYLAIVLYNIFTELPEDRHTSAVGAIKIIEYYIEVMNSLGRTLPYNDVKSFFKFHGYTDEEYQRFESICREELRDYPGYICDDNHTQFYN